MIKEFFANYFFNMLDDTYDRINNSVNDDDNHDEPLKVALVNVGDSTMTCCSKIRVNKNVDNKDVL